MRMCPVADVTNEEILRVVVGSFVQWNIHKHVVFLLLFLMRSGI